MISLHEGQGPAPKKTGDRVLQLYLHVVACQPRIWRRLLVKESMWLSRLHDSIQVIFDWYDYQTHSFNLNNKRYGNPLKREDFLIEDDRDIKIADLKIENTPHFSYSYHFGTGWQVDIKLEEVLPVEKRRAYPLCIAGERSGPPEDCGGIEAFHDMLACIQEPNTEIGREWLEWLGPEYRPERCDLEAINKGLRKLAKS